MNEIERLRTLAASATTPSLPVRDVTGWVMQDIHAAEKDRAEVRVWQIAAGIACAAAVAAALVAIPTWNSMDNPLAGVSASLPGGLQ
jgi:hypothetical protein